MSIRVASLMCVVGLSLAGAPACSSSDDQLKPLPAGGAGGSGGAGGNGTAGSTAAGGEPSDGGEPGGGSAGDAESSNVGAAGAD
jgi:hypothetical protein